MPQVTFVMSVPPKAMYSTRYAAMVPDQVITMLLPEMAATPESAESPVLLIRLMQAMWFSLWAIRLAAALVAPSVPAQEIQR